MRIKTAKIWKSFFGVYLKFAWLKASKNITSRIFIQNFDHKASFSHFLDALTSCQVILSDFNSQKQQKSDFFFVCRSSKFSWNVTPRKKFPHGKVCLGSHASLREFSWLTHGEKVTLCCFWPEKIPTNHLTWRHGIQKVRKWRLMAKILCENVRDMLFLDVFNRANLNTPQNKMAIMVQKWGKLHQNVVSTWLMT